MSVNSIVHNSVDYQEIINDLNSYLSDLSNNIKIEEWWLNFGRVNPAQEGTPHLFTKTLLYTISVIDKLLEGALNLILHDATFQSLEASWRGLHSLVINPDCSDQYIKIKLLDIHWNSVARDLKFSLEFDQSMLFKKIYSEEFDHPGGEPFGLLIGDYNISHNGFSQDGISHLETLRGLSEVAAAAFAPLVLSVHPSFFGVDSFSEFRPWLHFQNLFQQEEYLYFKNLRNEEDMRFLGLLFPRVLVRHPYRENSDRTHFYFTEEIRKHEDYLWGNAIYSFAIIVARSFSISRWFTGICGAKRGYYTHGVVTHLFKTPFNLDRGSPFKKPLLESKIAASTASALNHEGFIVLCENDHTDYAVFYNAPSLNQPLNYDREQASNNARLSSKLDNILNVSRFAHYIKLIARNKIGSFISPFDCENYLRKWLLNYTSEVEEPNSSMQAKYPLREFNIQIKEPLDKPGVYLCLLYLKPHFCVEDFNFTLFIASQWNRQYERA